MSVYPYGGECPSCGAEPEGGHEATLTMYEIKFLCDICGDRVSVVYLDDWSD